jgi:hypothetical protein
MFEIYREAWCLLTLFGEGAGEGRHPEEMPVRGDGGEVRGVSEEVRVNG